MTRFQVGYETLEDLQVVALTDRESGRSCRVARLGATLLDLQLPLAGKVGQVLAGYDSASALREGVGCRSWIMAPFSNRIRDGRYDLDGNTYQLAINDRERHNALHGCVFADEFFVAAEECGEDHGAVTLRSEILRRDCFAGYPFDLDVEVTFRLTPERLVMEIGGRNVGAEAAPFGCGWHPYFQLGTDKVDELELTVPAAQVSELDERCLPLPGEAAFADLNTRPELDFRPGENRQVGHTVIDHAYAGLAVGADGWCRTTVRNPQSGGSLTVLQERGLMHVYSADTLPEGKRQSLALEPVEFMTDAYNRPECLERMMLAPGESRVFRFAVETQ